MTEGERGNLALGSRDARPEVRVAANVALCRTAAPGVNRDLCWKSLGAQSDFDSRWEALDWLQAFLLREEAVIDLLRSILREGDWMIKIKAAQAAAALCDEALLPELKRNLRSKHLLVRIAVIKALSCFARMDVVEDLAEQLGRDYGRAAWECARSLKKLLGVDFGIDVRAWEQWIAERKELPSSATLKEWERLAPAAAYSECSFYGMGLDSHNLMFVIDISLSMQGERYERLQREFASTIEALSEAHSINVIFFAGKAQKWSPRLVPGAKVDIKAGAGSQG